MERIFTLTFQSTEFTTELQFTIKPRGPPHAASNLTSIEVRHDSVKLFWFPGFNGGEAQTFSVELRPFSPTAESTWRLALSGVEDLNLSNMWTEAVVTQLSASTDYEMRIVSSNHLGQVRSGIIRIQTTATPDESLSFGATAGIIIAVLLIIALVLIILYIFVFRKRWAGQRKQAVSVGNEHIYMEIIEKDEKSTCDDHEYIEVIEPPIKCSKSTCDDHEYIEVIEPPIKFSKYLKYKFKLHLPLFQIKRKTSKKTEDHGYVNEEVMKRISKGHKHDGNKTSRFS